MHWSNYYRAYAGARSSSWNVTYLLYWILCTNPATFLHSRQLVPFASVDSFILNCSSATSLVTGRFSRRLTRLIRRQKRAKYNVFSAFFHRSVPCSIDFYVYLSLRLSFRTAHVLNSIPVMFLLSSNLMAGTVRYDQKKEKKWPPRTSWTTTTLPAPMLELRTPSPRKLVRSARVATSSSRVTLARWGMTTSIQALFVLFTSVTEDF